MNTNKHTAVFSLREARLLARELGQLQGLQGAEQSSSPAEALRQRQSPLLSRQKIAGVESRLNGQDGVRSPVLAKVAGNPAALHFRRITDAVTTPHTASLAPVGTVLSGQEGRIFTKTGANQWQEKSVDGRPQAAGSPLTDVDMARLAAAQRSTDPADRLSNFLKDNETGFRKLAEMIVQFILLLQKLRQMIRDGVSNASLPQEKEKQLSENVTKSQSERKSIAQTLSGPASKDLSQKERTSLQSRHDELKKQEVSLQQKRSELVADRREALALFRESHSVLTALGFQPRVRSSGIPRMELWGPRSTVESLLQDPRIQALKSPGYASGLSAEQGFIAIPMQTESVQLIIDIIKVHIHASPIV